jgi:hypothetical protein
LQFRKEQGAANLAHSYGRILQAKLAIKGNPAVSGVASIFMVVDLTIYATEFALSDQLCYASAHYASLAESATTLTESATKGPFHST